MTIDEFLEEFAELLSKWEYDTKQDMLNGGFPLEVSPFDLDFYEWLDDLERNI